MIKLQTKTMYKHPETISQDWYASCSNCTFIADLQEFNEIS